MIDPDGLLMIEPTGPASDYVTEDAYTSMARSLMREAMAGKAYKGSHVCACGKRSDSRDWYVDGIKTNSLLVHYVARHRSEVPRRELEKLEALYRQGVRQDD